MLAPVLVAIVVGGAVIGFAQTRGALRWSAVAPRWSHLLPRGLVSKLKGAALRAAVWRLGKTSLRWSLAYLLLGGGAISIQLRHVLRELRSVSGASVGSTTVLLSEGLRVVAWRVSIGLVLVAALDYWVVRRGFWRRLRMTKQEVQREQRDEQGDPSHRSERQRFHRELLQKIDSGNVQAAHFVVVNPTHLAVALRYDKLSMASPEVVAKGEDARAAEIVSEARLAGIPIFRNVPLARALYRIDSDDEIPDALYDALAEIVRLLEPFEKR
jgi:flagellar biosynthesis protein FlhB